MQPPPQVFRRPKSGARAPLQGNTVVCQISIDHGAAEQLQTQAEQSGDRIRRTRRLAKRPDTRPLYSNAESRSGNGDIMETEEVDGRVESSSENDNVDMTSRNNPRRRKYFTKPSLRGFNPERAHRMVRANSIWMAAS